jgi:Ca-activated chloride channel family protein
VLIVTDAEVTDAGRILRLASEGSKQADPRRISVLCVDAAPNSFLAQQLAERGGGVAKFLTSAPEEEDISTALDEVLADWAEPVLARLKLALSCPTVQASSEVHASDEAGWSLIELGDLPAGRTVWVAGRVPWGETKNLTFRVTAAKNQNVAVCRPDYISGEAGEHLALKALFGARRVFGLEFLIHSGYAREELLNQLERLGYDSQKILVSPSGKPPKVYAENVREEANEALRGLLVQEALHYGLASSETSFVAVRMEAGKQVEGSVAVANALPVGWSEEFLTVRGRGGTPVAFYAMTAKMAAPQAATGGVAEELLELAMEQSAPAAQLVMRRARMSAEPQVRRPAPQPTAPSKAPVDQKRANTRVMFSGVPQFVNGEAILFDSSLGQDASKLPDRVTINRLSVRFPDGTPPHGSLAPGLSLFIFVDDLSSPKAKSQLVDLVRQGGERPLNLLKLPGQVVRIVLVDPAGAWTSSAPAIEVALGWKAG